MCKLAFKIFPNTCTYSTMPMFILDNFRKRLPKEAIIWEAVVNKGVGRRVTEPWGIIVPWQRPSNSIWHLHSLLDIHSQRLSNHYNCRGAVNDTIKLFSVSQMWRWGQSLSTLPYCKKLVKESGDCIANGLTGTTINGYAFSVSLCQLLLLHKQVVAQATHSLLSYMYF